MENLINNIRGCTLCAANFEHEPRPVLSLSPQSRIALIGQAPGRKVHESGIPWDDASGKRLRTWLGVNDETFYDNKKLLHIRILNLTQSLSTEQEQGMYLLKTTSYLSEFENILTKN